MKIKLATFAVAAFFSTTSLAESPTWNLVEVGYGQADIDDISEISPSGFSVLGSGLIGENVFIRGSYSILTDDFEGID